MEMSLPARWISLLILKTFDYQLVPEVEFFFHTGLMLRGYNSTPKLINR